jgi:hypothetical protein
MISVCTFLWTDPTRPAHGHDYAFTPDHVLILRNMVARHLTLPYEFVCVTDRPFDADGVRCLKLDMTTHVPGTVYARLMMRRPDIGGYLGRRILSLDLDCVITGSLDSIVDRPEDAVFWRNPNYGLPRRAFYQTSIQLFTAGARSELWTDFDPVHTPRWVNRRFGGAEQAWASERLSWDEAYWDENDGIYGAGRLGGNGVYTELPENARIVFTPGNRIPSQLETQEKHPWISRFYL